MCHESMQRPMRNHSTKSPGDCEVSSSDMIWLQFLNSFHDRSRSEEPRILCFGIPEGLFHARGQNVTWLLAHLGGVKILCQNLLGTQREAAPHLAKNPRNHQHKGVAWCAPTTQRKSSKCSCKPLAPLLSCSMACCQERAFKFSIPTNTIKSIQRNLKSYSQIIKKLLENRTWGTELVELGASWKGVVETRKFAQSIVQPICSWSTKINTVLCTWESSAEACNVFGRISTVAPMIMTSFFMYYDASLWNTFSQHQME